MARRYFNGVKKLSFNGNQFSFEFEDKYQTGNGELISDGVVTLVTELDRAEDIFKYLLSEIDKIKKLMPDVLIFKLRADNTSPIFAELLLVFLNTLLIKLMGPSNGSVPNIHVNQIR